MNYDVVIIGGGPAGMSTALYCSRAGLKVALIERYLLGGQLNETDRIENYIGVGNISAMDLAEDMVKQIPKEVDIVFGAVIDVDKNSVIVKRGRNKYDIKFKNLVIATGASHKKLENDVENIQISYCAVCDGSFYKNKNVAVIGGGDSAFEEALYLSKIAKTVKILVRNIPRAKHYLQKQIQSVDNIEVLLETKVVNLELLNGKTIINDKEELAFDGIFVAIGINPNNELLKIIDKDSIDDEGYAITDENLRLVTHNNIYIAGDLRQPEVKQLVNAVADGAIISKNIAK